MDSHKHDTTDVSLYRQRELLRLEYDYEKEAFRRETQTMGIGRKVKRGDCWFPAATGRSYYNAMGRFVVEITRNSDTDIEHNFEPGRPLCFFSEDASGGINYLPVSGTVSYAEAARLVAELPDAASLATLERAERLGVQLSFDETTYRLMFAALDEAITARTGRMAELREDAIERLLEENPGLVVIGGGAPHILSVSLPGYRSEVLMNFLEARGISVSKSSACKKGGRSHVLEAMGLPAPVIDGALRLGLSRYTTMEELDGFCLCLSEAKRSLAHR